MARDDLDHLLRLIESRQIHDLTDSADADAAETSSGTVDAVGMNFDQHQIYGPYRSVTNLLRHWTIGDNGEGNRTAYLLGGAIDDSGRPQLPTFDDIRANYRVMTSGRELTADDLSEFGESANAVLSGYIPVFTSNGALEIDALGDPLVGEGGGASNGTTAIALYTVWSRNHNYWVDRLKAETSDQWSADQYFEAARIINTAEYHRVVFRELADALTGATTGDTNFDAGLFDEDADDGNLGIESELASYVDPMSGETRQVRLSDIAFDKGSESGASYIGAAMTKTGGEAEEEKARRLGGPVDLATLNAIRSTENGAASFSQVRADLFAMTGMAALLPYDGWHDFQARNDLSDELLSDLQTAYPEGFEAMDLWVGSLAEHPTEGQLGATLATLAAESPSVRQDGDGFGFRNLLEGTALLEEISRRTFTDILRRTTGQPYLPGDVVEVTADHGEEAATFKGSDADD